MRISILICAMIVLFSCKEEDEEPTRIVALDCHNSLPANTYVSSDDTLFMTEINCFPDLITTSTGGVEVNITLGSYRSSDFNYVLVLNEPGQDEAVVAAVYGANPYYSSEGQLRLRVLDDGTRRFTWCKIEALNNLNVSQASASRIISGRVDCE